MGRQQAELQANRFPRGDGCVFVHARPLRIELTVLRDELLTEATRTIDNKRLMGAPQTCPQISRLPPDKNGSTCR